MATGHVCLVASMTSKSERKLLDKPAVGDIIGLKEEPA